MKCIETYVTLCAVCYINILLFQRPGFGWKKSKTCQIWIEVLRTIYSLDSLLYTVTILFIFTPLCVCNDMYLYFDKHGKTAIWICMSWKIKAGYYTYIFQNYLLQIDFSYKSMSNGNCYTKFGSNFCCYASFFIRDNTFSDRNTSRYHMSRELIVTKISIFIGVSIRHSIMIKVNIKRDFY